MGTGEKLKAFIQEAKELLQHVMEDRPIVSTAVPLVLVVWVLERWLLPFSFWVPIALAVWATIQYERHQRHLLLESVEKKWKQMQLYTSPITPLEQCEWLNKFLMEVWPNFMSPKLGTRFSSIVEKRLKHRKPRFIESIELLDFSLGSGPPILAMHGTRWSTSGDKRILRMGFEWDTNNVNIILLVKMARPLVGTGRIGINSLHIKGELLLMPILDGQAVLYSFDSPPEVKIGIAFGSGGGQALPATEVPGVSSWLDKLFRDTLVKTMVEPHRRCYSLSAVDLKKKAVGGILSVTVVSASQLVKNIFRGSNSGRQQSIGKNGTSEDNLGGEDRKTFVEVELGELTRRTNPSPGLSPSWNKTLKMVLHEDNGILRFNLYEWIPNSAKHDYMTSCEIKVRYAADDSTVFWAVGPESGVLAKRAEIIGEEVEMVVPFEGINIGQLTVKLVLREWTFSDDTNHLHNPSHLSPQQSIYGTTNIHLKTGRKLIITVMEGRDLGKEKCGKSDPYLKLQYGKALVRTRTVLRESNPVWNQKFELDEIGGCEYLKIRCYRQDTFSDNSIGSARVNLEGLTEGSLRDVWVPLEKVNAGEVRIQIEAVKNDAFGRSKSDGGEGSGLIELSLIEARDLVAADLRGTSDPYVRVQYGNVKRRTKVIHKTLHPQWNQTLEFPDDGSPLLLFVKDHNSLLPTSSIGNCTVEYNGLPPNQMADKWIPLQGVTKGEIHVQITRKVPELPKKSSFKPVLESLSRAQQISTQMRQTISKLKALGDEGDDEGISMALIEMEDLEDEQEEYMVQLEKEGLLLINKISELGNEINRSPRPRQVTLPIC